MALDFLGNVADMIPELTAQFNKGYQTNQLSIAEAHARAAEAMAASETAKPKSNMAIWIAVIAAIVIIALILMLKS